MRFAIVVSRFNQGTTQKLLDGARRAFKQNKIEEKSLKVVWVPGAYEIPFAAKQLAKTKSFDAIVALGCVIKGETTHNLYISEAAAHGLMNASLETGVPMAFGILTPDNQKQAEERSGNDSANKGTEAALAALEMAQLKKNLKVKK